MMSACLWECEKRKKESKSRRRDSGHRKGSDVYQYSLLAETNLTFFCGFRSVAAPGVVGLSTSTSEKPQSEPVATATKQQRKNNGRGGTTKTNSKSERRPLSRAVTHYITTTTPPYSHPHHLHRVFLFALLPAGSALVFARSLTQRDTNDGGKERRKLNARQSAKSAPDRFKTHARPEGESRARVATHTQVRNLFRSPSPQGLSFCHHTKTKKSK